MTQHIRMNAKEWDIVTERAKTRFVSEEMKDRPTRNSVAKTLHNKYSITLLEWLGFMLLIFIGIVTAFKMTAVAIPFAHSFFPNADNLFVLNLFAFFMATTFVLLSTSGLIYFKLMDEYSLEVQKQKAKHSRLIFSNGWQAAFLAAGSVFGLLLFSAQASIEIAGGVALIVFATLLYLGGVPTNLIQWISPRLYLFLTYFTAAWLLVVSSAGQGNFFERYGVVFAEIALAYLVANLLEKNSQWQQAVYEAWSERTVPYDERLERYFTDPQYLKILYRELRETIANLERSHPDKANKKHRPNYNLITQGDSKVADEIIMTEYRRHTGGMRFAAQVIETKPEERAEPQVELVAAKKRIPPMGDQHWTTDSLEQDFIVRGLKPSDKYNEKNVNEDYAGGYDARKAFREGAQHYFQ